MKLFVYGTLKKGCSNYRVMEMYKNATYLTIAFLDGYKLYTVGHIPFIAPSDSAGDFVQGEVYEIDAAFKQELDAMEQGYKLTRVKCHKIEDLYCYMPEFDVTTFDDTNIKNYTPEIEYRLMEEQRVSSERG